MNLAPSLAERLASLPPDMREDALSRLGVDKAAALRWDWRFWARPNQLAPEGDWFIWLVLAGRGFGKTRLGAEWVRQEISAGRASRIAIVADTAADARDVLVEGSSGLLGIYPPDERPSYEPSKRRLTWPNGAVATLYSAEDPDQLRGPQHDLALCFIAGTMVLTEHGEKPIEDISIGDLVQTRLGLRMVSSAGMTDHSAEIWEMVASDGRVLVGTGDHPVFVPGRGFCPLRGLRNGDTLSVWKTDTSSGAESAGISIKGATSRTGRAASIIASFTSTITEKLARWLISTTETRTSPTTISPTSWRSRGGSIFESMGRAGSSFGEQRSDAGTPERMSGGSANLARDCAPTVARRSLRSGCAPSFAPRRARRQISGLDTRAITVASVRRLNKRAQVYNITVDDQPEYFANGILVHNCDELAKYKYMKETYDQIMFGLRLGTRPRMCITTTPRPVPLIRELLAREDVAVTRGGTRENRANLASTFWQEMRNRYEGTRLGRQELDGEVVDDVPGALWTRRGLDECRTREEVLPSFKRVLVAVDPAVTSGDDADETGIIVVALGDDGRAYVLADASTVATPQGWATRAISMMDLHGGDAVVVEVNQGGDMVANTIRSVRPSVKIIEVRATRGKHVRAEPVSALYEQGRVAHVGGFPELEDQMVLMTPTGYQGDNSPDRLDALVWGVTGLFEAVIRPPASPAPPKMLPPRPRGAHAWMTR